MSNKSWVNDVSRFHLGRSLSMMFVLLVSEGLGQRSRPMEPTAQQQIQTIIDGLPQYSPMRRQLEQGFKGNGKQQRYMDLMKLAHVRRAFMEIQGLWKNGQPTTLKVAWRLYFDKYDGPSACINDSDRLKKISDSGLEDALDRVAFERMSVARLVCVDCQTRLQEGEAVYGRVELYDNPWLREARTTVMLEKERAPALYQSIAIDNVVEVAQLLEHERFDQEKLDLAFRMAAGDPMRDLSDILDLLLRAGADINSKARNGTTPLMLAIRNPAHVQFLLKRGAVVNQRDDDGKTALDRAKAGEERDSVFLLERARAH